MTPAELLQARKDALRHHWSNAGSAPDATERAELLASCVLSLAGEAGSQLDEAEVAKASPFFASAFEAASAEQSVELRQLRASAAELRTVTDALPVLVSYVTADQRYGMVNRAYEEWFGVPCGSLVGKTLLEVIGPGAYATLRSHVERGLAGEHLTFEQYGVPYRLGGARDVRVQFVPHRSPAGEPDGYVALLQDITQQRALAQEREALMQREQEARAAAQAERERQLELFIQAPVPIAMLEGPQHVFSFANPAYLSLLNGRQVLGKPLREALPDWLPQRFERLLDQVMHTGEPYSGRELRIRLADASEGEDLVVNFVLTPKRNAAGAVDGVLLSGCDVTEQVHARERVEQLRHAAEDANRSKDEFMAMLGHEMRNPLAPISTALQLMKLKQEPAFAREREVIERQVDHLAHLVDDLLDVSRITSGKVELKRERLNVAAVVARSLEVASPLLEQRQHHLSVSVVAHGLYVEGDALRLSQVVSNLLTNAAKYTDVGGKIEISAVREGADVVLRIKDNGVGILPEMLPRVFDLFSQERQSMERARGGLGLGLTIVRSLVEMHGGKVGAHSEGRGLGSEFSVRLPSSVDDARGSDAQAARTGLVPTTRPRRILIVDDNADAATLLSATLECLGHETRVAYDGPSALQVVLGFQPEVAVLDIGLPAMDGYELAERLRSLPHLHHTRLIALTGYGQGSDQERSRAAGFDAHCVKPVQLSRLEELLREA